MVIVNYFMVFSTIVALLFSLNHWVPPVNGKEWLILISLGIAGNYGQLYVTKAIQIAAIHIVTPINYLESVLAIIIGICWFGEGYGFFSILGVTIIIARLVFNTLYKQKLKI
ncbi:EamA family transporter [Thalassobellus suaedae]|uniref:EamA family transporter n=1 Tax=Thalassobellus suaedae TaxID=3074124 RepID=A0ABY9Y333_9FLAO|nr:EamA family transporter [Flavobacteriaceae bacterium HL-DH10]